MIGGGMANTFLQAKGMAMGTSLVEADKVELAAAIMDRAKAMGKDPMYVRLGIQQGVLKFGIAIKVGTSNEFSYYCSDKLVWEQTGYFNPNAAIA